MISILTQLRNEETLGREMEPVKTTENVRLLSEENSGNVLKESTTTFTTIDLEEESTTNYTFEPTKNEGFTKGSNFVVIATINLNYRK